MTEPKKYTLIEEAEGRYRGTGFSIRNKHENFWAFYLYIFKSDYGNFGALLRGDSLDDMDFHGGITYLHKITDADCSIYDHSVTFKSEYIKVGCDYMHLYDEPGAQTFDSVLLDVHRCIDSGIELGVLRESDDEICW